MRTLMIVMVLAFVTLIWAGGITCVDIQPKANHRLDRSLHNDADEQGNDLSRLPKGEQKFGGVDFKIGPAMLQLGSTVYASKPLRIEGIKVGSTFSKLHLLHATGFGNAPVDNPAHVANGTLIAEYILRFEDKSVIRHPVVFGTDVKDWWGGRQDKDLKRGKIVWRGTNKVAEGAGTELHLFLTSWQNPKPNVKVETIDFVSAGDTAAAPFCVAMTVE